MLIYSITYYANKNNKKNLREHFIQYNRCKCEKYLIISLMVDDIENKSLYYDKYTDYLMQTNIKNYKILVNYNWGGTIAGLWYVYKYVNSVSNYMNSYIAHFEEDFKPITEEWLEYSKYLLDHNECYTYIGETNTTNSYDKKRGIIKYSQLCRDNSRWKDIFKDLQLDSKKSTICGCTGCDMNNSKKCRNCCGKIQGLQVWTDGGFYFSTLERLKLVEKRIGIFHKGNQNTKWHHVYDGIELGEVGFPTILFHNGFNFTSIARDYFFKHE